MVNSPETLLSSSRVLQPCEPEVTYTPTHKGAKPAAFASSFSWTDEKRRCDGPGVLLVQLLRLLRGSDSALGGPICEASVWNDVEGQTGDCGCRISITSEGTEAPVCHLSCGTPPPLPNQHTLYPVNC